VIFVQIYKTQKNLIFDERKAVFSDVYKSKENE